MSVPPISGTMPTAHYEAPTRGISPEMVELRERLQRLELGVEHMRETLGRATNDSTNGRSELNNRLTSQYQRIASLEDNRTEDTRFIQAIAVHLNSIQSEIDPLLELQQDMERSAKRKARIVEALKWGAPALGGILAVAEKLVPGIVTKLWM